MKIKPPNFSPLSLGLSSEAATLFQISRTSTKLISIVKFQMKLIESHAIEQFDSPSGPEPLRKIRRFPRLFSLHMSKYHSAR
jgi:hypothetical protein